MQQAVFKPNHSVSLLHSRESCDVVKVAREKFPVESFWGRSRGSSIGKRVLLDIKMFHRVVSTVLWRARQTSDVFWQATSQGRRKLRQSEQREDGDLEPAESWELLFSTESCLVSSYLPTIVSLNGYQRHCCGLEDCSLVRWMAESQIFHFSLLDHRDQPGSHWVFHGTCVSF